MQSIFSSRNIFYILMVFAAAFYGCTKISSTDIGSDLIPAIDGVITKDTLMEVITDSFDDLDSVRVYKGDTYVLGNITNDPLFGKSKGSMFFEISPIEYPFYIPGKKDSIVVDSAVLVLSYAGFYGDSTLPLNLRLYEINQSTLLDKFTAYPANYPNSFPVQIGNSLAGPKAVDIRRIGDSVNNRYENAVNQIRIPLTKTFAERFLKTYDSTNAYRSDSIFRTYFPGFAITADGGNAMLKIRLADTNTKLAFYYSSSSTGATTRDTSVAYFRYSAAASGSANIVYRDRSGSEAQQHFTTSSKPDSLVYVQTSPGTYVRIRIPGLASLSNRIIHRAELIAEQVPDDANINTFDKQMPAPRYLLLSCYDSANKRKLNVLNDYELGASGPNISSFGGFRLTKSIGNYSQVAAYNFNLSRYVQGIVTRKDTSYTLRLTAPTNDSISYRPAYPQIGTSTYYLYPNTGNDVSEGRVRLGGGTHSRFRMRLRVVFSRI